MVPLPGTLGSDAQMWVALHHQCGIIQFIPQTSFYQGPELWCMFNARGGGGVLPTVGYALGFALAGY